MKQTEKGLEAIGKVETHISNGTFAVNVPLFDRKLTSNWKTWISVSDDSPLPQNIIVEAKIIALKSLHLGQSKHKHKQRERDKSGPSTRTASK